MYKNIACPFNPDRVILVEIGQLVKPPVIYAIVGTEDKLKL